MLIKDFTRNFFNEKFEKYKKLGRKSLIQICLPKPLDEDKEIVYHIYVIIKYGNVVSYLPVHLKHNYILFSLDMCVLN